METSPLAKKHPENPALVRRFEAYVACQELANAFSEINDPDDQRERFLQQAQLAARGDEEAHPMDEDFLRALRDGTRPICDGREGQRSVALVRALYDSARTGAAVTLPVADHGAAGPV